MTVMQRRQAESIMRRVGWLSRQPRAFQDKVLAQSEVRQYPMGSTIYNLGDRALDIWGLIEGELGVLMAPEAPAPHLVHIAQPGWWVGDAALITESTRRAGLIARQESWVLRVTKQSIDQLAKEDSEVWRRIAQISIGHLDHTLSIIAALTSRDTRVRVAITLQRLANHDGEIPPGPATIHVSHEELGEMAHLTRNTLAPVLKELETVGLIRLRYRAIEIPDIAALDHYATARTIKSRK